MTRLNWNKNTRHVAKLAVAAVIGAGTTSTALAESVKFDALVTQKEELRLDFADSSKHRFVLVRREGKSEGQGVLAGATVQEYGAHDIVPGVGGEPRGYLEFTKADGDKAYIKWTIQGRVRHWTRRQAKAARQRGVAGCERDRKIGEAQRSWHVSSGCYRTHGTSFCAGRRVGPIKARRRSVRPNVRFWPKADMG